MSVTEPGSTVAAEIRLESYWDYHTKEALARFFANIHFRCRPEIALSSI